MATKPTNQSEWATTSTTLPVARNANKARPRANWRTIGVDFLDFATAQEFNWQFNNIYLWELYFEELTDEIQVDVSGLQSQIDTNASNISTNTSDITAINTELSTNVVKHGNNNSLLNNDSDYQNTTEVNALIAAYISTAIYPVGHILFSTNSANPSTYLGFGTWVATATGKTIFGAGTNTDDRGEFYELTAGATGGEKQHVLTVAELATHSHDYIKEDPLGAGVSGSQNGDSSLFTETTEDTGSDTPHNNMPPYLVTYIWERTA